MPGPTAHIATSSGPKRREDVARDGGVVANDQTEAGSWAYVYLAR